MSAARPRSADTVAHLRHLASRFFEVVASRPLRAEESEQVRSWLGEQLSAPFFAQPAIDQRHGFDAGRRVLAVTPDRQDLLIAAALHDIGKRHARLGIAPRVATSLLVTLGIPVRGRFATYRDHGALAASELEQLGAPPIAVRFARHHHAARPDDIDEAAWQLLVTSDQPSKTRGGRQPGIFSARK